MHLVSHSSHVHQVIPLSHPVIVTCDFIVMWPFCDFCHTFCDSVTSHVIIPILYLSNKRKEKKKKRNINNDLAVLLSHDNTPTFFFSLQTL